MSTEQRQSPEPTTDENHNVVDAPDPPEPTEKPDVTDEHKQKAKEMRKDYEENRPTVTMPGTAGAVSGTAVNEWIDDDGNPKYGDEHKTTDHT